MKKLILVAALFTLALGMEAKMRVPELLTVKFNDLKWMKSETGNWMGSNKTWYKLNTQDATIWMSTDRKKWDLCKDGIWQDKDGKWLQIVDMDLKWSADDGKTWTTVPEWTWQGADGKWYKFEKDWNVWVA